jgi:hypothetical protein
MLSGLCGTCFVELSESEGGWALESGGKSRSVRGAAEVNRGQRRQKARGGNDSIQEKGKYCSPIRAVR